jgi:hypothetical protein
MLVAKPAADRAKPDQLSVQPAASRFIVILTKNGERPS